MAPSSGSSSSKMTNENAFSWQLAQYNNNSSSSPPSLSSSTNNSNEQHTVVPPWHTHFHSNYHYQYYPDAQYYHSNAINYYHQQYSYNHQPYDPTHQQNEYYSYGYVLPNEEQYQVPPPSSSNMMKEPPSSSFPSEQSLSSTTRKNETLIHPSPLWKHVDSCVTGNTGTTFPNNSLSSTPTSSSQKQIVSKKKFGSFMGKLLLVKGNKSLSSTPNKPVNSYFRTQKSSSTTTTTKDSVGKLMLPDSPVSNSITANTDEPQHEKPVSLKNNNNNKTEPQSTSSPVSNASVVLKPLPSKPLPVQQHQQEYISNEDYIDELLSFDDDNNDDLSSLSSLQSEDNVLGPWNEEITDEICPSCESLRDEHAGPMEADWICMQCKNKWAEQLTSWMEKITGKKKCAVKKKRQRQKQQQKKNIPVPSLPAETEVNYQNKKQGHSPIAKERKKVGTKQRKKKQKTKKDIAVLPPPSISSRSRLDKYVTTGAFMTRNTAKQLADPEDGFHPNPYGYIRKQKVEVLNINGHWYRGVLTMMQASKVKVAYSDWQDQEEWIKMGSRRIRIYNADDEQEEEEEEEEEENNCHSKEDPEQKHDKLATVVGDHEKTLSSSNTDNQSLNKQLYEDPLLPHSNVQNKSRNAGDDYVSATLDKDPHQIFNDNEVFLTRRMARQLTDEHGFRANSFGYHHNRAVAVSFKQGSKRKGYKGNKIEYLGYLREMRENQVRIWYPTLCQSDWLVVGSRRLRLLTKEEEEVLKEQMIQPPAVPVVAEEEPKRKEQSTTTPPSLHKAPEAQSTNVQLHKSEHKKERKKSTNVGLAPAAAAELITTKRSEKAPASNLIAAEELEKATIQELVTTETRENTETSIVETTVTKVTKETVTQESPKRKRGRPRKYPLPGEKPKSSKNKQTTQNDNESLSLPTMLPAPLPSIQELHENEKPVSSQKEKEDCFLTTGAFATRRAMRQLKDEHGFVPNPYGYTYNKPIEVLNTKTAKNKRFWERGHLIAMKPGQVKVRYDGWSEIYDEWFMVGSRRIRFASIVETASSTSLSSSESNNDSVNNKSAVANESPLTTSTETTRAVEPLQLATKSSDLIMATEMNPELKDLAKKKHVHRIIRPEDYEQLGYLVPTNQPPPRRREDHETTVFYPPDSAGSSDNEETASDYEKDYTAHVTHHRGRGKKRGRQPISASKRRKKQQEQQEAVAQAMMEKQQKQMQRIRSGSALLRHGGGLTSSDDHGFVANVYGYDYMQHVQVLNLDKKWYEARLVRMDRNRVRIHYCGWVDKFDEYIPLGSRRLQMIENPHEVICAEPNFKERYEALLLESKNNNEQEAEQDENQQSMVSKRNSRRRTLSEELYNESNEGIEYHKEGEQAGSDVEEIDAWKVYCNQCNVVIKQFRYYCTYCETPSEGYDYESFELCLRCFDQNFPFWHHHPRSSFAVQAVINSEIGPMPIKGELVTIWEEDVIDEPSHNNNNNNNNNDNNEQAKNVDENNDVTTTKTQHQHEEIEEASKVFTGDTAINTVEQGYKYLKRWQRRKVCAFCNDDDDTSSELGQFIGPFVIATYNKNGVERKRQFWAHDACARYSPEVFCTPEGKWYNVTLALRRGRGMRCFGCKEKGATIGCFDSRCSKSFHLPCAQKPVSYFRNGVIFWCPTHEAYYNKKDTYVNIFKCDGCNIQMKDESWFTCLPCASGYFSSFDLCAECFEKLPEYNHPHDQDDFEETSFAIIKEMEAEKARETALAKELSAAKRKKPLFPRRRRKRVGDAPITTCCYCGTEEAEEWRKGYDGGVIMCRPCFEVALLVDNNDGSSNTNTNTNTNDNESQPDYEREINENGRDKYVTLIEEYTHKPYLTRDALSSTKFTATAGIRLPTYEPQPHQLFSLIFDSTYYDIPGRAPRWASHSGTDYHGTWLPQTVRRAILKHTEKDERVLSNFLGRGTDAIECFLLQRRCCGVDINPAAVALSQRNCCFEIPPGLTSAEYRPIVAQADSRHLTGPLFGDESFHHVLSHPPYKDCVAYSTHLDGDLSRFTNIEDFKEEYIKVVHESWRVLKMGRRLTLGIGDNREHCFYIPVGYHLIRQYIDNGFELEELIIKRQRYCSAFGLGTYLCVQFDFLVFTHEFIATFRKIPKENVDRMISLEEESIDHVQVTKTSRGVPSSAIARKSVVMGTVWVFKPTDHYRFDQLCMSRMVERFGRDDTNWIQVELDFISQYEFQNLLQVEELESGSVEKQSQSKKDIDEENLLSEYEQQRLKRIEENTRTLVQLGLISELSEDSTDIMHYETMMRKPAQEDKNAPLRLMVIAHLPHLFAHHIGLYRQTLIKLAVEAVEKLAPQGMLIIGTQDIRSPNGKLWPLGMLVMEDIERTLDSSILKLKEMIIAVPDGYSKDRHQDILAQQPNLANTTTTFITTAKENENEEDIDVDVVDEHLKIVHATYLVFQKI
ncbi:hypothetical protein BDC45DRAFT_564763 [Circinella umbellata]|nr:hypothetical protein BDC45DRAFT_564763 [Circinella umbellata]